MPNNDLQTIVCLFKEAVSEFYEKDHKLLFDKDNRPRYGMEQSCFFRIAHYFCNRVSKTHLVTYDIDVEYNKNGRTSKIIDGKKIRPDLIVHERHGNERNLLAVECKYGKYGTKNIYRDRKKLAGLTCNNGEYNFALGLLVILHQKQDSSAVIYKYFKEGREISCEEYGIC